MRLQSQLTFSRTADVFASGDRLEDVVSRWLSRFHEGEERAVAEIVNLVLRAAGCDSRVDEVEVANPDDAPERVQEIQEEFSTVGECKLIRNCAC